MGDVDDRAHIRLLRRSSGVFPGERCCAGFAGATDQTSRSCCTSLARTSMPGDLASRDRTPTRDRDGRRRPSRSWSVRRSLGTRIACPISCEICPIFAPAAGHRFLIAAGDSAIAALDQAPTLELSGLVCLSPRIPSDAWRPPRSPRVPKLLLAGSLAGNDLHDARRLATVCGGWAVVTSYPVAERGTQLLASPWGRHLIEEIGGFLRDCQRRPAQTSLQTDRTRPGTPSAPRGCPQFSVSERPGTSGRAPSEPGR